MRHIVIVIFTLLLSASAGYAVPRITGTNTLFIPTVLSGSTRVRGGAVAPVGHEYVVCRDLHTLGVSWWRTWWHGNGNLCPDIEYVPVIWSSKNLTPTPLLSPSSFLLTFNEPNLPQQANVTPEEAVAVWPLVEHVAGNRKIFAPSTYAGYDWEGGNWLDRFIELCVGCKIDGIDLHWYSESVCDERAISKLENYLVRRTQQFPNLPIWLSEWGCRDDEVWFTRTALPIVERYTERNALWAVYTDDYPEWEPLIRDGNITELGYVYLGDFP